MTDINEAVDQFAPRRSIQEFRIDFFLEEEFLVDPAFGRAFLQACGSRDTLLTVDSVYHQSADKHCIADLIVMARVSEAEGAPSKLALLIENKITAAAQPTQSERYRKRGLNGVSEGLWDKYLTVLVGPAAYVASEHGYDSAISLEAIKDWIPTVDEKRRAVKHAILDAAIEKKNATGIQIVDHAMTTFRQKYFEYVQEFNKRTGSGFVMKPPRAAWFDDTWFKFKHPSLPSFAEFRHLARTGNIGLDLKGVIVEQLEPLKSVLAPGMYIESIGSKKQNASIKFEVGAISSFDNFDDQSAKIESALAFADSIRKIWNEQRAIVDGLHTNQ